MVYARRSVIAPYPSKLWLAILLQRRCAIASFLKEQLFAPRTKEFGRLNSSERVSRSNGEKQRSNQLKFLNFGVL
jgi:hypothetical protein